MEITISIPKNDYVQPTTVRPNVVEMICKAFIDGQIYHPHSQGRCRQSTNYVFNGYYGPRFGNSDSGKNIIRFNGEEMKAAFNALHKAGYYMWRVYEYSLDPWMGYRCTKKPYCEDGTEWKFFNDFID